MILDQAGELIADIMTANRSLKNIPSASAILDTSNYTFQAISYGKDSKGFQYHAHSMRATSGNGKIIVVSYEPNTVSSYHTSAVSYKFPELYEILPNYPAPMHTRLEQASSVPKFALNSYPSALKDFGQCLNTAVNNNANVSSLHNILGCYSAASGTVYIIASSLINQDSNFVLSGNLSSLYNQLLIMDSNGFLTFTPGVASAHVALNNISENGGYTNGALRVPDTSFPKKVTISWVLGNQDAGALLLFGGIYHIGLWYLDMKSLLKQGIKPPYSFNALNNKLEYKLYAKKTFNKDLLSISNTGFKSVFEGTGKIKLTWDLKFN